MDMTLAHERLIALLETHPSFVNKDGSLRFKKRNAQLDSTQIHKLDHNEVNAAVALLVTAFNMTGGSVPGKYDFYQLLQAYILHPECRETMDQIAQATISIALDKSRR